MDYFTHNTPPAQRKPGPRISKRPRDPSRPFTDVQLTTAALMLAARPETLRVTEEGEVR